MTSSTNTYDRYNLYRRCLIAATIVTSVLLPSNLCFAAPRPETAPETAPRAVKDDASSTAASDRNWNPLVEGLKGSALAIALARAQGREQDEHDDAQAAADLFRFIDQQLERRAREEGENRMKAHRKSRAARPRSPEPMLLKAAGVFGQIAIHTDAWIAAPDGRHPGVSVTFYRTTPGETPLVTRAVFPVVGQSYAVHDREAGRSYGSRPRLGLSNVVVDVLSSGSWQRVRPTNVRPERNRTQHDPRRALRDICDASCSPGAGAPFTPSFAGPPPP